MTDEEKELEEKTKQYKYQIEENEKNFEKVKRDATKKGKKSFTYMFSKITGSIVWVWLGIVFIAAFLALLWGLNNYVDKLNAYNPLKITKEKYDINIKMLSREAEDRKITFKVKTSDWEYKKLEFTIIKDGNTRIFI